MSSRSWMIERLNQETAAYHPDADADLDPLFRADAGAAAYMLYLMRVYGFEAPLESSLTMTPGLDLLIDVRARARSAAIASDLMQLGLRPSQVAEMPQCLTIPQFRGAAEALGWMYVAERCTLAHSVIKNHLGTRLPAEIGKASAYLSAYAGTVGARWRDFGEKLDKVAHHPAIADRIVHAAGDAFRCQRRWMQQEHRTSTTRMVG